MRMLHSNHQKDDLTPLRSVNSPVLFGFLKSVEYLKFYF